MKVVLGCIVRNRAWVLPDYLRALQEMRVPGKRCFLFIENDSVDGTRHLLSDWCDSRMPWDCEYADVMHLSTGVEGWDHHQYSYSNLAHLRNRLLEWFLAFDDADFFMSVDSDVIVQPDTFEKLYATHQRTGGIVAAAICNVANRRLDGLMPGNFMVREDNALRHPMQYPMTGGLPVAVTGAVYLIPRAVIAGGVRYAEHPQGEDIPFCLSAAQAGCPLHVNMDARCEHRMARP